MKWFYIDESILSGDRRTGPLSTEEIKALRNEGKISDTTLVWHKGLEQWKPWNEAIAHWEGEQNQVNELLQNTLASLIKEKELAQKPFAGFWIRSSAYMIDMFLLSIAGTITAMILNSLGWMDLDNLQKILNAYYQNPMSMETSEQLLNAQGMPLFLSIVFLIQSVYFIVFHARYSGTIGKMLLHLHVEKADGSRLGFKGSVIRYAFSLLTQATLFFYGAGYILAAIDPQKRALHDFFAKTRVLRSDKPSE